MTFEQMKAELEWLCRHYGVPVAVISEALPEDPCDVTDPPFARINLRQDCDRLYQVRHLFGHWLHDIALWDPEGGDEAPYSDVVADAIARMITETQNGYFLDDTERRHAEEWMEQHRLKEPIQNVGLIGGRFAFTFIPTSINTIKSVHCTVCGEDELLNEIPPVPMSRKP